RHHDELASLIENLSSTASRLLKYGVWTTISSSPERSDESCDRRRTSIRWTNIELPSPEMLHDRARREEACATVIKLCQYGGGWIESRKRPSGKRSWTWRPYLRAPEPRRHFPKREAERTLVMWLRTAWLDATGEEPPRTADPRRPGPVARMVKKCLSLVGASHADAVGLLNLLNERLREMQRRAAGRAVS